MALRIQRIATVLTGSAILCWLLLGTAYGQELYVQSSQARLYTNPSFQSDLLTTLPRGSQVTLIARNSHWVQIRYQQHSGWISDLLLADRAPQEKISVFTDAATTDEAQPKARRRASVTSTAAATRGLSSDVRSRLSNEGQSDFSTLRQIESRMVSEEQAIRFRESAEQH